MKDFINETLSNGDRLFLSHLTSSTHHPWGTPSHFSKEQYFSQDGSTLWHQDMDDYLNTIRYVDLWLGNVLKLLRESGIANETLIVLAGDQ